MKFIALLALFGGISALRLESHTAIQAHSHAKVTTLSWAQQAHVAQAPKVNMVQLKKAAKTFVQTTLKDKLPCELTPEQ